MDEWPARFRQGVIDNGSGSLEPVVWSSLSLRVVSEEAGTDNLELVTQLRY